MKYTSLKILNAFTQLSTNTRKAVGKICGEQVSFYPPGIPVLLPGELVTEEIIAYCQVQKELGLPVSGPADSSLQTIRVIAD